MKLLTRDQFRTSVFERDSNKCVICGSPAKDAHHIVERRLFDDGGYYLDNGASLCGLHHLEAEQTVLSCDTIREACGITTVVLPSHLYGEYEYDKWGNIVLPAGGRVKGELFYDESVQKVLAPVLHEFGKYVKYPRTMHLPWSKKSSKDDVLLDGVDHFLGKEVVVTVKLDGENTTMYRDHIHARSLDSGTHPSRKWVKGLWGRIAYDIPEGWRICGENMYAKHTIHYQGLQSYFYVFSIWDDKNNCLSWDETLEYASLLDLKVVPVLYRGTFDKNLIRKINTTEFEGNPVEGYVVRLAEEFPYGAFRRSVAKYVNPTFEIVHGHWISQQVIPNGLL